MARMARLAMHRRMQLCTHDQQHINAPMTVTQMRQYQKSPVVCMSDLQGTSMVSSAPCEDLRAVRSHLETTARQTRHLGRKIVFKHSRKGIKSPIVKTTLAFFLQHGDNLDVVSADYR
jgi:hypothetical protein